jgi:hypothetical protein
VSDENDEDEPERVSPVINQEEVSHGHMQHVFPHGSVTVITLRTTAAKYTVVSSRLIRHADEALLNGGRRRFCPA